MAPARIRKPAIIGKAKKISAFFRPNLSAQYPAAIGPTADPKGVIAAIQASSVVVIERPNGLSGPCRMGITGDVHDSPMPAAKRVTSAKN